ncbi:MAG: hypothetical protein LKE98_05965 [Lachnospiraceae bacterium]|nr:hypothetical protein [Lachnospiraceae bacterium]
MNKYIHENAPYMLLVEMLPDSYFDCLLFLLPESDQKGTMCIPTVFSIHLFFRGIIGRNGGYHKKGRKVFEKSFEKSFEKISGRKKLSLIFPELMPIYNVIGTIAFQRSIGHQWKL